MYCIVKTAIINPVSDISLHKKYTVSFGQIRTRKKNELIQINIVRFGYDQVAKHEELNSFGPHLKANIRQLRKTKKTDAQRTLYEKLFNFMNEQKTTIQPNQTLPMELSFYSFLVKTTSQQKEIELLGWWDFWFCGTFGFGDLCCGVFWGKEWGGLQS